MVAPSGPMSDAVTDGVRVEVMSRHMPEQSSLNQGRWLFEYTVRITNQLDAPVQLMSRHWFITDALERVREVAGEGVVGKQPVLQPGEQFQYSSWCPLSTPTGFMYGTYLMTGEGRAPFTVQIAPFGLRARYTVH